MLYGPGTPCLDPDRPLTRSELADERWERRSPYTLTRAHVERLETSLRWALEQIEYDPDQYSDYIDALALLEGPE
jgi:hypothetical protein